MKTKFIFISLLFGFTIFAQESFWRSANITNIDKMLIAEDRLPSQFISYEIDLPAIENHIFDAPLITAKRLSNINFSIPDENGNFENFIIYKSTTLPEILKKNNHIYTYRGYDAKGDIASIVISPLGLRIEISRTGKPNLIIEPATPDLQYNIVYSKEYLTPKEFQCFTDSEPVTKNDIDLKSVKIDDGVLRTYRFAVGTTGEYSQFHINRAINLGNLSSNATDAQKKAVVLAAVTETIDRVNSVYERDFGVTLSLVTNETEVIFLDPNTDPYDNSDIISMLYANTGILNSHIGSSNYDGGHLFSTYSGGGISGLGVICSSSKGQSVTGSTSPRTDTYDIDYVAHEIGHEFGCNHTFANSCNNNRNISTSVEPGSGSTIMAYAGVCSPNIQFHSDDYFSVISIAEAGNFIQTQATCSVNTDIGNHTPSLNLVNYGSVYIPKSTPFMLKVNATDQNANDALTYCWEEIDIVTNSVPSSWTPDPNYDNGPLFRSYAPTTNNSRYFPKMNNIIYNTYGNTWEKLPAVNRTLTFAVTVRDNHPGGGQSPSEFLQFDVDDSTGPFRVTNLSSNQTWQAGDSKNITWDPAGTTGGLVNCSNVDILFSYDNGVTFPEILASNIPNNGSANFNVPNTNTNYGRVMVKGHNNYFFDLAKGKFKIQGGNDITENNLNNLIIYPNPASQNIRIKFDVANTNQPIKIKIFDVSGREVYYEIFKPVSFFNRKININDFTTGIYFIRIENANQYSTKKLIFK